MGVGWDHNDKDILIKCKNVEGAIVTRKSQGMERGGER